METNVNQNIYRASLAASICSVSLATALLCGTADRGMAQSAKKITPDPYYSTLRQSPEPQPPTHSASQSFYQSAWEPPKTETESTPARRAKIEKANSAAEVWASVARKTTKPVTRIDFSRLDIKPPKTADVSLPQSLPQPLKPAFTSAAPSSAGALKPQALTPIQSAKEISTIKSPPQKTAEELIRSAVVQSRSIIRQQSAETNSAESVTAPTAQEPTHPSAKTPVANSVPPTKARPLNPWKDPAVSIARGTDAETPSKSTSASKYSGTDQKNQSVVDAASKIAFADGDGSFVQQAAYQPQLGERLKKMVEQGSAANRTKAAGSSTRVAATEASSDEVIHVADASGNYFDPTKIHTPQTQIYSQPKEVEGISTGQGYSSPQHQEPAYSQQEYSTPAYQGESFENSRVLALVGGHPVFVGDMMFEVNQIFEKHMKGAPQAAKDAQKGKLMERLLPKYIDQKILFVSTLDQLPEEANIDDILKQAEKTFNEQALPDLMENSGVESVTKFDAILRSQGTSVRQMRRAWAKDQISKFFLQEKVKFNRQVTHLEMLDEYRSNYDQYEIKAKVRWEQIEIHPAKAGGRIAAKDKIEGILDRLVHGGNFEAIAKKESHGFRAFKGGQYDWTRKGSLVNKEIDKSIFTLPQGKLSGIIETKSGFHIIRVIERIETHHTPFTEAQVEIKKRLLEARRDEAFRTYIDGLKDKIKVEYVNE